MMIDFHTHILPGIDDGSKSYEMSLKMLREEYRQGVEIVVATPHFYASHTTLEKFLEKRYKAVEQMKAAPGEHFPYILAGAEVAFFPGIGKAEHIELLCIQWTRAMLLEMPFIEWTQREIDEVRQLIERGITVIIAHAERYVRHQKKEIFQALMELPVYVQVNADCLDVGLLKRKPVMSMFKNKQVHLLGSDCHNLSDRAPNIKSGRERIESTFGARQLRWMDEIGTDLLGIGKK